MSSTFPLPVIINPNQALWEKGDFTAIAAFMRESGEAFVDSLGEIRGLHVLDLGCGDGTTALPLARRGAFVRGIDIARNLVEAGRRRAWAHGLSDRLSFEHGDVRGLGLVEDGSSDLTLTMFGAMFAPDPLAVARELVRVTRPGGRIVMGNWIPGDSASFVSQLLRISANYAPPPPAGFVSPMEWGDRRQVLARFAAAGVPEASVGFAVDRFVFRCPGNAADFLGTFRRLYGPTMNAYAAAARNGLEDQLHCALLELAGAHARPDGNGVAVTASYLRVTVQR